MLNEIGQRLSSEGLSIGAVILLWIVMTDEKAYGRARRKPTRYLVYFGIFGCFLPLIIDITKIVISHFG